MGYIIITICIVEYKVQMYKFFIIIYTLLIILTNKFFL